MAKWEKGQSGNPNGAPKGDRALLKCLRALAEQPEEAAAQARALWENAKNGNAAAIKEVWNRILGETVKNINLGSLTEEQKTQLAIAWLEENGENNPDAD